MEEAKTTTAQYKSYGADTVGRPPHDEESGKHLYKEDCRVLADQLVHARDAQEVETLRGNALIVDLKRTACTTSASFNRL